jgi:hypothetical protein
MIAAASLKLTPTNTGNGRKLAVTGQEKVARLLTTSQAEAARRSSEQWTSRERNGDI